MKSSSFAKRSSFTTGKGFQRMITSHCTAVVGNCIKISVYHVGTHVSDTQPVV